jgi:DNA mismatch endonuclease, patch repair protein
MSRQRRRDTQPELALRSELHRRGMRFRVHRRPLPAVRREADVVFPSARVAVFVDGCFWHGCPKHRTWPQRNSPFWASKIEGNVRRDSETDALLAEAGWAAVRVWEHERPERAAARIARLVASRRAA